MKQSWLHVTSLNLAGIPLLTAVRHNFLCNFLHTGSTYQVIRRGAREIILTFSQNNQMAAS